MQQQKGRFWWMSFLLFLNIGIVLSMFAWHPNVLAHSYQPAPKPQVTQSLPDQLATQQAQIDNLERQVQNLDKDNQLLAREYQLQLNLKLWGLGLATLFTSSLAALLGWKSYSDIGILVRERIEQSFDKEILGFDPKSLKIRLRKGRGLERIESMLKLYQLSNIDWYTKLNKACTDGVFLVPMENKTDEEEFAKFIDDYNDEITPNKSAYVVYALKGFRVENAMLLEHECITLANLPVTAANAVLIVGRALR